MKLNYNISLALTNLLRRKRVFIVNILMITISLTIILLTSTLNTSLNRYIDEFLYNSLDYRTLLINTFKLQPNVENSIANIAKDDEHIVEFNEELFGVVTRLNSVETHNFESEEKSYGNVVLKAAKYQYENFIIGGDFFNSEDTHVGIIPKKFFPDTSFQIDYYKNNIDFIDGESLIGKTITVEYYARDYSNNTLDIVEKFSYSFKVVGVYDIVPNHFYPYDVIIPYNDLKSVITNIEQNNIGLAEDYNVSYTVIVDDQKYVEEAISKLYNAGFIGHRVAVLGPIGEISKYILYSGNILGLIILITGLINLTLTMIQSMKRRTGEIGLMKAIGYNNKHLTIIGSFEAIIIGTISFIISCTILFIFIALLRLVLQNYGSMYIQAIKVSTTLSLILRIGIISIAVPLLGSICAMRYAMNISPKLALSKGRENN